jgi:phenylacetate-CoA ligase
VQLALIMQKLLLPRGYKDGKALQRRLLESTSIDWTERGQRFARKLFKDMSRGVPAYKLFLKAHGFAQIPKPLNLKTIPAVDKDNYLRVYPKASLCWNGLFGSGAWVISTTSGTTGQPYYFPRQTSQDWQYAVVAEQYLLANFHIDKRKTLYIVAFPMGAWIGGVFTYEAIKTVASQGYDLSIITPGIHKVEIINAVKQLAQSYDQVIIGAYAPFLKDILEDGEREGIDWAKNNTKFIFSAEAFSEKFRDYVVAKAGLKDVNRDTLNHYGTVDLGTMAHETPLSILIRRWLFNTGNQLQIFPEAHKQPTLCQYNPELFYFEEQDHNLYCSSYSGIPLFRYDLKDYGGVIDYDTIKSKLKVLGLDIDSEMKKLGLQDTHWKLPFVYVYERNDFSVSYYAFNLYPDPVRKALLAPAFAHLLTGKFTISVDYTQEGRQQLKIVAECAHGVVPNDSLAQQAQETIHAALLLESTEYPEVFTMYGNEAKPHIKLYPYEHNEHFRPGGKQKWVTK